MRRLTKLDSSPVSVSESADGASTFGYSPPSPVLYCDPNTTARLPLLRSPVSSSSYASTSLFASHTTSVAGDLALSALWQKSEISDVCGILSMAYRTAAAFRSRTFATILASATDLPVPDCPFDDYWRVQSGVVGDCVVDYASQFAFEIALYGESPSDAFHKQALPPRMP